MKATVPVAMANFNTSGEPPMKQHLYVISAAVVATIFGLAACTDRNNQASQSGSPSAGKSASSNSSSPSGSTANSSGSTSSPAGGGSTGANSGSTAGNSSSGSSTSGP